MKKILLYFAMLLPMVCLQSCLTMGVDEELPAFSNCEITNVYFDYRTVNTDNELSHKLSVTALKPSYTIDSESATIDCVITVPAKLTYPATIDDITLSNLVGYFDISTAAKIKPIGDAPKLGAVQDWSDCNFEYLVTAADGTEKVWTITIVDFIK